MQQFCDIFGKMGDGWPMILGDNPAGHGFVIRDLVLIELSGQYSFQWHKCLEHSVNFPVNLF